MLCAQLVSLFNKLHSIGCCPFGTLSHSQARVVPQFLGMSIWTYKDRSMAQGVAQTVRQVVTHPAQEAASWTAVWLPILMMYSPVQVVCTVFSLSFMLAPPSFAAAFWVGGLALYYAVTLPGSPEHTGQISCGPCCCCERIIASLVLLTAK